MNICSQFKKANVTIVSHVFATGPAQELEEYLKEKVNFLMFIGHPFSYARETNSFYKIYHLGYLLAEKKAFDWRLPELFMYIKDLFYTLFWIIKFPKRFDLYIGADPLNTLAGILLKMIKKIKKVVFYSIDYAPRRFNNKILNFIYHKIDSFCAEKSDFVWNLSERMIKARIKKGIKRKNNQMVVPIGVHSERINLPKYISNNGNYLVYMGHLRKNQGLELALESLSDIVKIFPEIRLIIIGGGELRIFLEKKVKELELEKYVDFKGYIESHKDIEDTLITCGIGLALYEPNLDSFTWYADPSKPKQYMACGLPVIITRVPWIAEEIEKRPMGIVINYNKEELVNAITKLITDDAFYQICRRNAIEFTSNLSWDKIYDEAFNKIGYERN